MLALNRQMHGADNVTRGRLDAELDAALEAAPEFAAAMEPHALAANLTLRAFGDQQPMLERSAVIKMREVKAGLGYEAAPPLERLLIEQIALCWLRQGEAELMYSQVIANQQIVRG